MSDRKRQCGSLTLWSMCAVDAAYVYVRVQAGALATVALGAVASQPHMVSHQFMSAGLQANRFASFTHSFFLRDCALRSSSLRLPGYHQAKLCLILWLSLPRFDGATLLWSRWIQPLLLRHESAIDARLQQLRDRSTELADQGSKAGLAQLKKWTAMLVVQVRRTPDSQMCVRSLRTAGADQSLRCSHDVSLLRACSADWSLQLQLTQVLTRSLQASKQARLTHTQTPSSSTVTLTLIPATPMRAAAPPSVIAATASSAATLELESAECMSMLQPLDEAPLQSQQQVQLLARASPSIDTDDSPLPSSVALLESLRGAVEDGLNEAVCAPAVQQLAGHALQHALLQQLDAENIDPAWAAQPPAAVPTDVDSNLQLQPSASPARPAKQLNEVLVSPRAAAAAVRPLGDLSDGTNSVEEAHLPPAVEPDCSTRPAKLSFVHSRKAHPRVSFATVED